MKRQTTILLATVFIGAMLIACLSYGDGRGVPHLTFPDCMTGPGGVCSGWCCSGNLYDFDGDEDVDLADWAQYTLAWESWQED